MVRTVRHLTSLQQQQSRLYVIHPYVFFFFFSVSGDITMTTLNPLAPASPSRPPHSPPGPTLGLVGGLVEGPVGGPVLVHFQLGVSREVVRLPGCNLSYRHAKKLASEIITRKVIPPTPPLQMVQLQGYGAPIWLDGWMDGLGGCRFNYI